MNTGSLINHIADTSAPGPEPEVGMGATEILWSDRHAGTIMKVSPSGHQVFWQEDRALRTDDNGMSDAQTYRYERNPAAPISVFTRRKDGSYRLKGGETRLALGVRDAYHDYSF